MRELEITFTSNEITFSKNSFKYTWNTDIEVFFWNAKQLSASLSGTCISVSVLKNILEGTCEISVIHKPPGDISIPLWFRL